VSELRITPAEPLRSVLVFGAMLAMCLLLTRKRRHVGVLSAAPLPAEPHAIALSTAKMLEHAIRVERVNDSASGSTLER
jgi:hypothetical protein